MRVEKGVGVDGFTGHGSVRCWTLGVDKAFGGWDGDI